MQPTASIGHSFVDVESDGSRAEDGLLSSECDTPVYDKPQFGHYFREDSADKHVQFNIGKWERFFDNIILLIGNYKQDVEF